jgi:hypothetical protein
MTEKLHNKIKVSQPISTILILGLSDIKVYAIFIVYVSLGGPNGPTSDQIPVHKIF